MSSLNGRRLTPEEIQARLPKILLDQRAKDDAQAARKKVIKMRQEMPNVGTSLGDRLRRAYKKGMRVQGPGGRFLGLPKSGQ